MKVIEIESVRSIFNSSQASSGGFRYRYTSRRRWPAVSADPPNIYAGNPECSSDVEREDGSPRAEHWMEVER